MSIYDSKDAKRIIEAGTKQATDELNATPRHMLDPGNPNHPRYDLHLFGEHYESFLRRQYK